MSNCVYVVSKKRFNDKQLIKVQNTFPPNVHKKNSIQAYKLS